MNRLFGMPLTAAVALLLVQAQADATCDCPSAPSTCCECPDPQSETIYRTERRTIMEEREETCYKTVYDRVPYTKTVNYTKYVTEQRQKQVNYTVCKPVWETKTRTYTVCKPVWETRQRQVNYKENPFVGQVQIAVNGGGGGGGDDDEEEEDVEEFDGDGKRLYKKGMPVRALGEKLSLADFDVSFSEHGKTFDVDVPKAIATFLKLPKAR